MVAVQRLNVHRPLLRRQLKHLIYVKLWRKYFQAPVPCSGTPQNYVQKFGISPMKQSTSPHSAGRASLVLRLPRNAGRAMIWLYRHTLSPLVGYNCRHVPTCSVYADQAIERFGLWGGGWMTLARLLRCQPFGTSGIDNVPLTTPPGARWYLPWRFGRWRGINAP